MILLFTTETCGACKLIKSYLDVNYTEVMLGDDTRDRFAHHGVKSAPTLLFIKNGQEQWRHEGYVSQDVFNEKYKTIYGG